MPREGQRRDNPGCDQGEAAEGRGEREEPVAQECTRGEITVWDAATGRALRQIELDDPVYSSALSPDGTRLATTGYDGSVTVWGIK